MHLPSWKSLLAAGLAVATVLAVLGYLAITRGGAAVIALQMTTMLVAALGPVSVYTYVQRRRAAEDETRRDRD